MASGVIKRIRKSNVCVACRDALTLPGALGTFVMRSMAAGDAVFRLLLGPVNATYHKAFTIFIAIIWAIWDVINACQWHKLSQSLFFID
ncbi:hypothetical protein ACI2KC_06060 [Pseudomonas monteilii]